MATDRSQCQIDRLLDEAEEAFAEDYWDRVRDRAHRTLLLGPENHDAINFLAAADRALGNSVDSSAVLPPSSVITSPPSQPADQPTSFANGRYEVKRFLGEGGKKKVHLAQDTLLDREVAFALIKTEGLDDVSRTRITREAQAMGRLGSHPHIVTVFDLGEQPSVGSGQSGQPYMVTELMGGGDAEGVIEAAPDHRLSLEQAVDIAKETCWGLEFARSRDIVHRDLKPGNVWLTGPSAGSGQAFGTSRRETVGLSLMLARESLPTPVLTGNPNMNPTDCDDAEYSWGWSTILCLLRVSPCSIHQRRLQLTWVFQLVERNCWHPGTLLCRC